MSFRVTRVIDGDTFEVSSKWEWNDQTGNVVRVNGYDTPEKGESEHQSTKDKLENLILNKDVELKNPIRITYGRLLCDVYYNGKNIADYFPEYQ